MKNQASRWWMSGLAVSILAGVSGCQLQVEGTGVMTDLASMSTQDVVLKVSSRNRSEPCEASVRFENARGEAILSFQTNLPLSDEGEFTLDTSRESCDPSSKQVVVAKVSHRVIDDSTYEKFVQGNDRFTGRPFDPRLQNTPNAMEPKRVRVRVRTQVTELQGEVRDRATGTLLRTFQVTSEPRSQEI